MSETAILRAPHLDRRDLMREVARRRAETPAPASALVESCMDGNDAARRGEPYRADASETWRLGWRAAVLLRLRGGRP